MNGVTHLVKAPILNDVSWSSGKVWTFDEEFSKSTYAQNHHKRKFDQIYLPQDVGLVTNYVSSFYKSYALRQEIIPENSLKNRSV